MKVYQLNQIYFDKNWNEIKNLAIKYLTAERLDIMLELLNFRFAKEYEAYKEFVPTHETCIGQLLIKDPPKYNEGDLNLFGVEKDLEEWEKTYYRVEEIDVEDKPIESF